MYLSAWEFVFLKRIANNLRSDHAPDKMNLTFQTKQPMLCQAIQSNKNIDILHSPTMIPSVHPNFKTHLAKLFRQAPAT